MKAECSRCGKTIHDDWCINLGGDTQNEYVLYHKSCIEDQLKSLPDHYMAECILDALSEDRMIRTPDINVEKGPDWDDLMDVLDFRRGAV